MMLICRKCGKEKDEKLFSSCLKKRKVYQCKLCVNSYNATRKHQRGINMVHFRIRLPHQKSVEASHRGAESNKKTMSLMRKFKISREDANYLRHALHYVG